jgi:transcriptional regulator with XRE-family HTH domain
MSEAPQRTARTAQRIDEHVGERIRQRRTVLGLTQEQLSQSLSISYQQLQKYETAANRVSAGRLFEIANKLDVDIGYFFEGLKPGSRDEPMPHGGRNRISLDLVKNFMDIQDPSIRSAVASLVKSLSENPAFGAQIPLKTGEAAE